MKNSYKRRSSNTSSTINRKRRRRFTRTFSDSDSNSDELRKRAKFSKTWLNNGKVNEGRRVFASSELTDSDYFVNFCGSLTPSCVSSDILGCKQQRNSLDKLKVKPKTVMRKVPNSVNLGCRYRRKFPNSLGLERENSRRMKLPNSSKLGCGNRRRKLSNSLNSLRINQKTVRRNLGRFNSIPKRRGFVTESGKKKSQAKSKLCSSSEAHLEDYLNALGIDEEKEKRRCFKKKSERSSSSSSERRGRGTSANIFTETETDSDEFLCACEAKRNGRGKMSSSSETDFNGSSYACKVEPKRRGTRGEMLNFSETDFDDSSCASKAEARGRGTREKMLNLSETDLGGSSVVTDQEEEEEEEEGRERCLQTKAKVKVKKKRRKKRLSSSETDDDSSEAFEIEKNGRNYSKIKRGKRKVEARSSEADLKGKSSEAKPITKMRSAFKVKKEVREADTGRNNSLPELLESDSDDLKSNVSFIDETDRQKRARIARNYIEHLDRSCRSNTSEISSPTRRFHYGIIQTPFEIPCGEGKSTPTKLAISSHGCYVFSTDKKGALIKWSLEKRAKIAGLPFVKRNKINNVAISCDDKLIAIGDSWGRIQIWTTDVLKRKRVLQGHRVSVTSLKFHKSDLILYSTGYDKLLKVWCVRKMCLLRTLEAHTAPIICLDLYSRHLVLTGGCDDKVVLWQIPECKQIIYKEHSNPVLAVKFLKEDYFISGDSNGKLIIWNTQQCESLCFLDQAHGSDPSTNQGYSIYSIVYAKEEDFIVTGSSGGFLILWKFSVPERRICCAHKMRVFGFVNDLALSCCGACLVAAVGKQSTYGEGKGCSAQAHNCIFVMPVKMFV